MPAGAARAEAALAEETARVPLIDHHVHGAFSRELSQAEFEESAADARRVIRMVARDNALRVYQLG